jgi:hypothetical protein
VRTSVVEIASPACRLDFVLSTFMTRPPSFVEERLIQTTKSARRKTSAKKGRVLH